MKQSWVWGIILQIIIGFILADIITGAFHWFEDTYIDYCLDIPIIDEISKDNELHHFFPRSIISYSYLDNISVSLPIVIIIFILLWFVARWVYKYVYFLISFGIFSTVSNIFHKFSHMRDCETSDLYKVFQNMGILCSHLHHSKHHEYSVDKYCVISEYNNYILDTIGFWRGIEYIIFLITGIEVNRKMKYQDYSDAFNHMHENALLECPDTPTIDDVNNLKRILHEFKKCSNK